MVSFTVRRILGENVPEHPYLPPKSDKDWWGDQRETYDDRPRSWRIGYDDGADGCMPAGWYAEGLDEHGFKLTLHEYGPFGTEEKARKHAAKVDQAFARGRAEELAELDNASGI